MDVQEILERARSGDVPASWDVWKLRSDRVSQDLGLFVFGAVVGLALFGFAASQMIPDNFTKGVLGAVLSLFVLAVFGLLGFGSLFLVIEDVRRLRQQGQYLLVMTPDDYVKVEPGHTTQVPMEQIADITLKGVTIKTDPAADARNAPPSLVNRLMGAIARQPKVSPSLAFRDRRTDTDVVVTRDTAFGDLVALEQALTSHVRAKSGSRPA